MSVADPAAGPRALLEQLIGGYRLTQMLYVVAELGVADQLARHGLLSAADLAAACGADTDALHRILRGLASVGIFASDAAGRFGLTPAAELLCEDHPESLRPLVIDYGQPWWWQAWGHLLKTARSGETAFPAVHGQDFFDYLRQHPAELARFNAHMTAMTKPVARAVAATLELGAAGRIVDVAGSHGILLAAVLAANPAVQGILFDLPEVIAGAREQLTALPGAERIECMAGSFFEAIPAGADLYLLKDIIHDWDDAMAVKILSCCRTAMGPAARLVLIERVIEPGDEPAAGKLLDISMLVLTGGRERTAGQYAKLLAAAGLKLTGISATGSSHSLIEAVPVG